VFNAWKAALPRKATKDLTQASASATTSPYLERDGLPSKGFYENLHFGGGST
jgi:hypothetical protein